jgi:hypothetical protein
MLPMKWVICIEYSDMYEVVLMSLYYEVRVIRYRLDYFGGSISSIGLFVLWVQLKERRKPIKRNFV